MQGCLNELNKIINGNNKDNRLENLQIVYPNCDAALSTFKGRNRKDKKIIIDYKTPKNRRMEENYRR